MRCHHQAGRHRCGCCLSPRQGLLPPAVTHTSSLGWLRGNSIYAISICKLHGLGRATRASPVLLSAVGKHCSTSNPILHTFPICSQLNPKMQSWDLSTSHPMVFSSHLQALGAVNVVSWPSLSLCKDSPGRSDLVCSADLTAGAPYYCVTGYQRHLS